MNSTVKSGKIISNDCIVQLNKFGCSSGPCKTVTAIAVELCLISRSSYVYYTGRDHDVGPALHLRYSSRMPRRHICTR